MLSKGLIVDRHLLKVEKVIGETTVSRTIEEEIDLPFKATKVYEVIASVTDVKSKAKEDGVVVSGVLHKQLFVVDHGDVVRHVPEDIPFEEFIGVRGVSRDMNAQVNIRVLTVDTELKRPAEANSGFGVFCQSYHYRTNRNSYRYQARDHRQKELLKVDSVVGEDTQYFTLTPTAILPITAKKIFRSYLQFGM